MPAKCSPRGQCRRSRRTLESRRTTWAPWRRWAAVAEPMLEIRGVTAGYGRTMVLFDVDVSIPVGGAAAVMGHNGAGKTTLLRAVVGLIPVRSGRVLLDGEDVTKLAPNRRVKRGLGYVPQGQ